MQGVHKKNLRRRVQIGFYLVSAACSSVALALLVHVVLTVRWGVASAYASNRAFSVLKVAPRDTLPTQFWFFIGVWCFGAVLLFYLGLRFAQLGAHIGAALRAQARAAAPHPAVEPASPDKPDG